MAEPEDEEEKALREWKLYWERMRFLARLASIEDLEALREGEGLLLFEDFRRLGPRASRLRKPRRKSEPPPAALPSSLSHADWDDWENLERLHRMARRAIVPLVDDKRPELIEFVRSLLGSETGWQVVVQSHEVYVEPSGRRLRGRPPESLEDVLLRAVTPGGWFQFFRCENCRVIFASQKAQRFHSADCQREATREHRRAYQRELMRRRRAEERSGKGPT